MAKKTDTRPRHQQIAAELRTAIMSGVLQPGERLPTTQQLMERYEVTSQTVQRTLQVLKGEGFVLGKPGVGVFVRPESPLGIQVASYLGAPRAGEAHPWLKHARERGQKGSTTLLRVERVEPPGQITEALELAPGESAVLRHQLLSLDNEPTELAWNYYPLSIAEGSALEGRARIRGGSPALLAALGFPPREHIDRVSARLSTTGEFEALELPDDVPVLRTLRTVYTDDARPVEASVLVKGGHRYELVYRDSIT
ncbi:GntR family transcriptional regulator [Nocardiopsis terrae]|uniref:GntR family transcriptional regulator n=1 Tax=Nocardiopsis terrae TaxID=372655 RepID=A0ABR9HNK6_9ACTN|nr:GntR family transcriptional regulator [Nocardiopsis terrae]MBE1460610.1 GntR family transcriptional regulator [Nocardiopsis terrae]GHC72415.1 GntR family transcriptional regulator [Nocardiopsis terrae]